MVRIAEDVKGTSGNSYRQVCRELDFAYSSLMRWKHRRQAGQALVQTPGPAKVEPLDMQVLYREIRALKHGRKRTRGTGALYRKHRLEISRRGLQELVVAVRSELLGEQAAEQRHIEWLVPGLVWAMDDAQRYGLGTDHLHLVRDLGSRNDLGVMGRQELACGKQVAANLKELFRRYGPPLFAKLDNGANLNHQEVHAVLGEHFVIALNSPPYYPPYNGGIEHAVRELKERLRERLGERPVDQDVFRLECEISGHELNHLRRPCLGGQTACAALSGAGPLLRGFGRRQRTEVFEEIVQLAVDIAAHLGKHDRAAAETAFRFAAETWMQLHQFIRVTKNGKVLPCYYQF